MSQHATPSTRQRALQHFDRWGLDALLLLALLVLGMLFLPGLRDDAIQGRNAVTVWAEARDLPFWGTGDDLLLVGPDAGAWASSAHAVHQGDWGSLDEHRMPTFSIVVGALLFLQPDVAIAGHLLNHLAMLLLPLVLYGLGRIGGGRGVGFGAGFLVACCGPLLNASRLYGIDPLIFFLLPASLLLTAAVRRWWWLAPAAGAVVAATTITHFTTLPMWAPPLLLLVLAGPRPWWRRLLATALFLATGAGALWLVFQVFPFPTSAELAHNISEGIAPGSGSTQAPSLNEEALAILQSGMGPAIDRAVTNVMLVLRPSWVPWYLGLALPWLGAVGIGLRRIRREPGSTPLWKRLFGSLDLALGVVLLSYLAPLPLLAAAQAPERYGWNLLPIAALLLMRGLASLSLPLEHGIRQLWGRWPTGLLTMLVAAAVAWAAWNNGHGNRYVLPPSMDGQEVRQLGELIEEHFEPGGGAVCTVREAVAHAGRQYCPQSPCPIGIGERFFEQCLATMGVECAGEGPLPFVVLQQASRLPHTKLQPEAGGPSRPERVAFDEWMLERYPPADSFEARQFTATLLSVPREDLR
jgi:hypothetical protein